MFELDHTDSQIICCLPSLRKPIPEIQIPVKNSFEFGRMLEFQYHLLEHVFKFLEAKDLHTASLINPVWDKAAKWELQKRISPSWISCSINPSVCDVLTSQGFNYNDVAICIIIHCSKIIKLWKYICLHDGYPNRMSFLEYIEKEVVPEKISYCAISCVDVPASNIKIKTTKLLYQGIYIPFIPNVRTTMFHYNPKTKNLHSNHIKDNEQVKCVLVFTRRSRFQLVNTFLRDLIEGQNPRNIAVGGGLIKSTQSFHENIHSEFIRDEHLFCIAFLEEKGVEADFNASSTIIIDSNVDDTSFETELLKFKENSILRKNGIIFRFCCCAKDDLPKMRETTIIEKHFPNYPLLGIEVDGEIGWSTENVTDPDGIPKFQSEFKKFKYDVPKSLYGWSTVLVLVTWGKTL